MTRIARLFPKRLRTLNGRRSSTAVLRPRSEAFGSVLSRARRRRDERRRQPEHRQWFSRRMDWVLAAGVGLCTFVLYLATLSPTVTSADSGELVTAAYELGVPHPPGYPLWVLLAHGFIFLFESVRDVAYRVNLLSAVCGAGTCAVVYLIAREMKLRRIPAIAAALLLGASRELWAQSIIAEVYALNAILFASCLLCLVKWDTTRRVGLLYAFSILLGLGMANHHTIGVLGPAGLLLVLCRDWRTLVKVRTVVLCVGLFVAPLLLYLYLPLRSARHPYMDWGHPETFSKLWEHVTRAQYTATYKPQPRTAGSVLFQLTAIGRDFLNQFSPVVGMFSLVLIPAALRRRGNAKSIAMAVLFPGILFCYGFLLNAKFERQEIEANRVFYVPVYICAAILIGLVLDVLYRPMLRRVGARMSLVPAHLVCLGCLLIPAVSAVAHNYSVNDFSRYWYAEDHAVNMLATLENNAVIFPSGDHNTFPLIYVHHVKGMRPDITIADKYGYVEARDFPQVRVRSADGVRIPKQPLIHHLLSRTDRPVYFTVKTSIPGGLKVQQLQMGILYRVSRKPPHSDPNKLWARYRYRNARDGFDRPPDYGAVNTISDYYFFRGLSLIKTHKPARALAAFSRAAGLARGIKEVQNNIGSALAEHGLLREAVRYYREALSLSGRYVNGLWNIARTESALGNHNKAAAGYFQRLADVTPKDFRVPGELGFLLLRRLGRTREASTYFRASLSLKSKQPQIHKALKDLALAEAGRKMGDVIKLDRRKHDFGRVLVGSSHKTKFKLTNISMIPVDLVKIDADCSCAVAKTFQKRLKPGQSTSIDVTFQENKRMGSMHKNITVKTSTGHKIRLGVGATVVSLFQSDPPQLEIREAMPRISQRRTLTLLSHDKRAFAVTSITSNMSEVQPIKAARPAGRRKKHTVTLEIKPGLKPGRRTGKLIVHIDAKGGPKVTVPVTLNVRSPYLVKPRSIFLSSIERGAIKTVSVTVDIPKAWTAKVTNIAASAEWITVKDPPEQLQGQKTLAVQIHTKQLPGSFSGTVTIRTDHESIPTIVIPIYGFVQR